MLSLADLAGFKWAKLRAYYTVEQPLALSAYPGSALRGAFGWSLRTLCCHDVDKECNDCLLSDRCAYRNIFEPAPRHEFLQSYSHVPPPYLVRPTLNEGVRYKVGDTLSFSLILIGGALSYIPHVVLALEGIAKAGLGPKRSRVRLREIHAEQPGTTHVAYTDSTRKVEERDICVSSADLFPDQSTLKGRTDTRVVFRIMTRLQIDGHLVSDPHFSVLIRCLLRRLSIIGRIHCDMATDWPFHELTTVASEVETIRDDTKWYDWGRGSRRQRRQMKFGGIHGSVSYAQVPNEFLPLLLLGEHLHVGKNTTFGLGAMQVAPLGAREKEDVVPLRGDQDG